MHGSLSPLRASDPVGATAVANYYTETTSGRILSFEDMRAVTDYYVASNSGARWVGGAVPLLGLVEGAPVQVKEMRRLLQRLDPRDGTQLSSRKGGRSSGEPVSAFDLTFSTAKDLSVLYVLGDEATKNTLLAIHDEAITEAIKWLEKEDAVVRRGQGGLAHRSASGLLAMEVDHTSARPVDGLAAPHLHRHFVIMNLAELVGEWTALDATRLFNHQKTVAAIADQIVRQRTQELLGLSWMKDDAGIFRVEGFDSGIRTRMSPRQQQIFDRALELGLDVTNREDWVRAQRLTREGKSACSDDPAALEWAVETLVESGVTYKSVMKSIHDTQATREQAQADRLWIEEKFGPQPVGGFEADMRTEIARSLATRHLISTMAGGVINTPIEVLSDVPPDFERLNAAFKVDLPLSDEKRIATALRDVGRKHSTWRRKDLLIALCDAGIPLARAEKEATAYLNGPDATYLFGVDDDSDRRIRVRMKDQSLYASTETLEKERMLLAATRDGLGAATPLLDEAGFDHVLAALATKGLIIKPDSDQYAMLRTLLLGGNELQLIAGQAGAGKSAGMSAFAVALEAGLMGKISRDEAGDVTAHRVIGSALAANAAKNLEAESGIPSFSITMLTSRLERGLLHLDEGAIVIVDECSQASTAQLADLWEAVRAVGGRLILMGDPRQLQAVEAGGMYRTIIDTYPNAVTLLDETQRQNNLEERAVLATLHDSVGQSSLRDRSLDRLKRQGVDPAFLNHLQEKRLGAVKDWYFANDRICVHKDAHEATDAVAVEYWNAVEVDGIDNRDAALVMARSNAEIRLLNETIISEAIRRGHLDPTKTVALGRKEYLSGQLVVARHVDRGLNILNGQVGVVEGLTTVVTSTVKVRTPRPQPLTKKVTGVVKSGDLATVSFTKSAVVSEIKKAEKQCASRRNLVSRAHDQMSAAESSRVAARIDRASTNLVKRRSQLKDAERWLSWAKSLPAQGGDVSVVIDEVVTEDREERLMVTLENGEQRELPKDFVDKYLDSGYALTTQRGQGQTVEQGILYGELGYVGMSRGRQSNRAHIVVPEIDQRIIDKELVALAPFHAWIEDRLGRETAGTAMAESSSALQSGRRMFAMELGEGHSATIYGDAERLTKDVAIEIASAHENHRRATAIVKTPSMAASLNNHVVATMVEKSQDRIKSIRIADQLWTKDMPVIAIKPIAGLTPGDDLKISGISKDSLFVDDSSGHRVELTPRQIGSRLEGGYAVTSRRAGLMEMTNQPLFVVASGLQEYDLEWLSQQSQVEFFATDPVIAAERMRSRLAEKQVLDMLVKDSGAGWQTRSAHALIADQQEEIGLESLQAEVKASAAELDRYRHLSPRDLAQRDLEDELIRIQKRIANTEATSRQSEFEEDRIDAGANLPSLKEQAAALQGRYQVLGGEESDDSPAVAEEIIISQAHHSGDRDRLEEAEANLHRYAQVRYTEAIKNPRDYHRIPEDPSLDPASAAERRRNLILGIEEFRTKWNIVDPKRPLGRAPEDGMQLDEWQAITKQIGVFPSAESENYEYDEFQVEPEFGDAETWMMDEEYLNEWQPNVM